MIKYIVDLNNELVLFVSFVVFFVMGNRFGSIG
jgi:hypothetical protein